MASWWVPKCIRSVTMISIVMHHGNCGCYFSVAQTQFNSTPIGFGCLTGAHDGECGGLAAARGGGAALFWIVIHAFVHVTQSIFLTRHIFKLKKQHTFLDMTRIVITKQSWYKCELEDGMPVKPQGRCLGVVQRMNPFPDTEFLLLNTAPEISAHMWFNGDVQRMYHLLYMMEFVHWFE